MSSLSRRQCYSLALIALVITTSFIPATEAGRFKGSSRKGGGSSWGSSSSSKSKNRGSSTQTQTHRTPNQSNVALSYPTSHQAAAAPKPVANYPRQPQPHQPSAPQPPAAANTNTQPIGWNVGNNNNNNAGGAGIQKATATQNNNAPPTYNQHPQYPQQPHYTNNQAPPPYSAQHPNGPPPAYNNNPYQQQSPYGHQGAPPPAYTPNGHGYPHQQQPHYNPAGGYPQQQPGYGGGFGGGYPQQHGGFGGGYGGYGGGQPVINNYYGQKSSGGLGLTNALLLGVGGLSLYNAFKPGETKIIYVNNSTNPEDARQVTNNGTHVLVSDNKQTVATPIAPFPDHCAQYMNMPYPPVPLAPMPQETPGAAAGAVPLAPLPQETPAAGVNVNVTETTMTPVETTTMVEGEVVTTPVPLAPLPAEQPQQSQQPAVVNTPTTMMNVNSTTTALTTPQIPQECVPFVTGQVLPLNYTAPAAPLTQPNPNIQYGNPQWQQNSQQQQQFNTVDATGARTSGGVGVWMEKVNVVGVVVVAVVMKMVMV